MDYYRAELSFPAGTVDTEILTAHLLELGFDSFEETEWGMIAYIESSLWNLPSLEQLVSGVYMDIVAIKTAEPLEDKNWNEVWEQNFPPVVIDETCRVRAPFHPADDSFRYELIIEPKMSFGTAHHETTSQVMSLILDMEWKGKNVLDMGSGTAILAVLAVKKGAAHVWAVDTDRWAYENALENIARNNVEDAVTVLLGGVPVLPDIHFDAVIANINKNVLLEDMHHYTSHLVPGGMLILSGFYAADLDDIRQHACKLNLKSDRFIERNQWVAACFYLNTNEGSHA